MARPFLVQSRRLRIRPLVPGDRDAFERMTADAEMMRYLTQGRVWQPEETDEFFERQGRHLSEYGYCVGALAREDDSEVVGIAGLQPLDIPGEVELAWWVWKDYWGQGFAPEAGAALIKFGFETLDLQRLVAIIDPMNMPSIRVAEKLGMQFERRMSARESAARREDVEVSCYAIAK
jgi:[ribosomal protein S5]-alanine N-acetyltransferase